MSSPLFQDEHQQFFKFPIEIWNTIITFYFDPLSINFSASRFVLVCVLPQVSKAFHKLMQTATIPADNRFWGSANVTNFLCSRGYASLLENILDSVAVTIHTEATAAVRAGQLDCLKVLEAKAGWRAKTSDVNDAIQYGQLNILRYLIDQGLRPTESGALPLAVRTGQLELVQLVQSFFPTNCLEGLGLTAAQSGSVEMVKYVAQYSPLQQEDIVGAGQCGSTAVLQYYLDNGFNVNDSQLCTDAAQNGHVECVKFLVEHGAPLTAGAINLAARKNDVELVRALHAKGWKTVTRPWDSSAVKAAAGAGCLDALKFLVENGCPLEEEKVPNNNNNPGFGFGFGFASFGTKTIATPATECAASNGHLRCLEYLMERGAPCPDDIIDRSISLTSKGTAIIAYLHGRGCRWGTTTTASAAQHGKLDVLKYLHENGCPWDASTCTSAALYRSEECLIYALDNGCPYAPTLMEKATFFGELRFVKILHERGVPWPDKMCTLAVRKGMLDVLRYAREHGAPWSADTITTCLESTSASLECFQYAVENGCPWDPKTALQKCEEYSITHIAEWIRNNAATDL